MDIDKKAAVIYLSSYLSPDQALLYTRNVSAEEAAMYYFNKLENEVPIS